MRMEKNNIILINQIKTINIKPPFVFDDFLSPHLQLLEKIDKQKYILSEFLQCE